MPQTGWKRAIIVGASSGIGEALSRQLASQGTLVALIARRESELTRIADTLNAGQTETIARWYAHDVRDTSAAAAIFAQAVKDMGGLDLFIYAAGIMPKIAPTEYSLAKDIDIIETNLTGAVAWLNEAAQRFEAARSGTLVGISSVAGERGRRGNTVYGASKAGLNVYLESLRNRIGRRGVRVVTVKPGPIKTPMTANLGKMPFMITAEEAASEILAAAASGPEIVYVPKKWRPIMGVIKAVPSWLFRHANI